MKFTKKSLIDALKVLSDGTFAYQVNLLVRIQMRTRNSYCYTRSQTHKFYKRLFRHLAMLRLINATEAKSGITIMVEGQACTVRSNDISKTGKHGASKCRIEAIEIFSGKKKVLAVPGHERFEVPMITKHKAQVLNIADTTVSVMDLESYETLDVPFSEDMKEQLAPEKHVEYWEIEGKKAIMKVL